MRLTLAHMVDRMRAALRRFGADQVEMHERLALLNRPWAEEMLHWSGTGDDARLHGRFAPPADRRLHSTTHRGWCVGLARARTRQ
jgi:hypothetical protein